MLVHINVLLHCSVVHAVICCMYMCRAASRLITHWPKVILEVDNEGDLPIHQACRQGNRDLVAVLLQQEQSQKDIKLIQLARLSLDLKYWFVCLSPCFLSVSHSILTSSL